MSKAKKTRQQKIISDLKKQLQTQPTATTQRHTTQYSYTAASSPLYSKPSKMSEVTYTYLAADLRLTIYLTAALLFAELILFILLRNHIISIPMVRY